LENDSASVRDAASPSSAAGRGDPSSRGRSTASPEKSLVVDAARNLRDYRPQRQALGNKSPFLLGAPCGAGDRDRVCGEGSRADPGRDPGRVGGGGGQSDERFGRVTGWIEAS
jgi:hypothetical protein